MRFEGSPAAGIPSGPPTPGRPSRGGAACAALLAAVLLSPGAAPAASPSPPAPANAAALELQLATAGGTERVDILVRLAEASSDIAPDKVVAWAQQAVETAAALGDARSSARAIQARATGYFQLGDLDRALASYQEALSIARTLAQPDPLVLGSCQNGIAAVAMKRGQLAAALVSYTEAIGTLEKAGNPAKLAAAVSNVSLIAYSRGKYDDALEGMSRALRLYEEARDEKGQGVVLSAIGNVFLKLGEPGKARENFERALSIAERTGHQQLLVTSLVNLSQVEIAAKEWDPALSHLERALDAARSLGNQEFVSVCLNNIGDVLREMGDVEGALGRYSESLRNFEAMNARPRMVVSYVNIGRLDLKTGRLVEAEALLKKGFELAGEVQERGLQRDAAEALAELYEAKGDLRRALAFRRTAAGLKEEIFSRENVAKIATMQSRLDAEKKEREIEVLRRETEVRALEVKRQRLWLAVVASGMLFLSGLAALLWRDYRAKARTSAELAAAYARMSELASHDELTGLYNRRSGAERLEIEMVRTGRTRRPFGILIVDVDRFKEVNDTFGHAAGDLVLKGLASFLQASVRAQDLVARWGGEEFLLVLPETTREGAALVAEKLRVGASALTLTHEGRQIRFTVTIGVDAYERLGPVSASLRRADEALYEGKRSGRDRVVSAPA